MNPKCICWLIGEGNEGCWRANKCDAESRALRQFKRKKEMEKKFDPTKPVQFRNGESSVRILCSDLKSDYPIVAVGEERKQNREYIMTRRSNGQIYEEDNFSPYDLINIPTKRVGWINLYPNGKSEMIRAAYHDTKNDADALAMASRIACIRIEWEE